MPKYPKNSARLRTQTGFTLVELLVVIGVLGALASVSLSAINRNKQLQIAADANRLSSLEKTYAAIQTFYEAEGEYYPVEGTTNNPLDPSAGSSQILAIYMQTWPTGFVYNESGGEFSVHVANSKGNYFKYSSVFQDIKECDSSTDLNNVSACTVVTWGLTSNSPGTFCGNGTCDPGEENTGCTQDCSGGSPPPPPPPPPPTEQLDQQNLTAASLRTTTGDFFQTFTAGLTGAVPRVELKIGPSVGAGTLYLRSGQGSGGTVLASTPANLSGDTWVSYPFSTQGSITAGSVYTVHYARTSGTTSFYEGTTNPYSAGRASTGSTNDIGFKVYVLN